MMEAEELVCRGQHCVVDQIFSVENVIIFQRAIYLYMYTFIYFMGLSLRILFGCGYNKIVH